ncbi:MAG: 4Fe-4S dicluster domain-containing protein [Candidatus Riflebacteria bacterium]|nr:4Fe-4S dicluster domain-containing protein [Candidatus Riflebacteria bacterium]
MKRYLADIWHGLVTTAVGMKITLEHMFTREVTSQYPDEKLEYPERFRGMLFNDISACICCEMCSKACPADCFTMEGAGKGKGRYSTVFDIHLYKCLWCGFCVEACPTGSLVMSKEYEVSGYSRDCMVLHFGEGVRPEGAEAPPPGTLPKVSGPPLAAPARPHQWDRPWPGNPAAVKPGKAVAARSHPAPDSSRQPPAAPAAQSGEPTPKKDVPAGETPTS